MKMTIFLFNSGDLDQRKNEFYDEIYQIRQEMSMCDYELHFTDKDSLESNGVNGTGIAEYELLNFKSHVHPHNLVQHSKELE